MKKSDIEIGGTYSAKVSGKVVRVRIDAEGRTGGWDGTNLETNKKVHIKSAQRLRGAAKPAKPKGGAKGGDTGVPVATDAAPAATGEPQPKRAKKAAAPDKPKRISALDAAAQVLQAAAKPLKANEMIVAMAEAGLWESPNGKTPHATLYAAILREIGAKGAEARFRKVERGQFEFAG